MKKILHILLFSFLIQAAPAYAQQVLYGRVSDTETLAPIEGVEIILSSGGKVLASAISDAGGAFKFSRNESGDHRLFAHHVAYFSDTIEVSIPRSQYIDIRLRNRIELKDIVTVLGIRAGRDVPVSFTNLDKKDVTKLNYGQDLPYMLDQTPGVLVHSDAGAGVGYTGMRIRGVDPTRINVTINGIPLNDAESHGVFWVDLPDLASSVSSIQIQRGVGTSTNGAAAFGASMNLTTDAVSEKPFTRVQLGAGSFETNRLSLEFGTGILHERWGLQGRISTVNSAGFIDRARSELRSMFLTGYYKKDRSSLKMVVLQGFEETYQAWWGVPEPKFKGNDEELARYAEQLAISGSYLENLIQSDDRTYNYYTYDNEVDHYNQDHYQLFHQFDWKKDLKWRNALHYTRGKGYFEQFQSTANWLDATAFSDYGRPDLSVGSDTIRSTDLIRRRWLDNHFGGVMSNLSFSDRFQSMDAGIAFQTYLGGHYGEVIWAQFANEMLPGYRYYENEARKTEGNAFVKWNRKLSRSLSIYADMQYRLIDYQFEGQDPSGTQIPRDARFHFVNPKGGVTWQLTDNQLFYLALARSNREPVREDFINSTVASGPKHETLTDLELGSRHRWRNGYYAITLYAMEYKDQLVLTGKINDVGAAVRENVANSYRRGLEFETAWKIHSKWNLAANLNSSLNKIQSYTEYLDDWVNGGQIRIDHRNTDLAFSPGYIAGAEIIYSPVQNLDLALNGKAVGRQYLDNTSSSERQLDPFRLANCRLTYKYRRGQTNWELGMQLNNLFNTVYAPNGYTFGAWLNDQRASFNYVYPQAGRHFMLRLSGSI
ncbi:MAG: TonB-dependent receptor [Flavobacteriales bacterium]|nr:TonB-dependent receptor [Flavobacteriales bacterium]